MSPRPVASNTRAAQPEVSSAEQRLHPQMHSLQTLGCGRTGPANSGFFTGCPLQCLYCHNSDTRPLAAENDPRSRSVQ